MDWQMQYIKKEVSYTDDAGTIYIDLPDEGVVGMILIEADLTVATACDSDNSILDCVEKIHVLLEGSKIGYSMQPEVGSYAYFLQANKQPPHRLSSRATGEDTMVLPVVFGRKPFDKEYALDLGLYKSAQLQIEYTVDTTDYDTTTFDLTVWLLTPREAISPLGFIRSRVIEDKASPTASTIHKIGLPGEYPFFAVFSRIYKFSTYMKTICTDLTYQADNDKTKFFDGRIEDLFHLNDIIFDPFLEGPVVYHNLISNEEAYTFMGMQKKIDVQPFCASDGELHPTSWAGQRVKVDSTWTTNLRAMFVQAVGSAPYGCLLLGDYRENFLRSIDHADINIEYLIGSTAPTVVQTCLMEVIEGSL